MICRCVYVVFAIVFVCVYVVNVVFTFANVAGVVE